MKAAPTRQFTLIATNTRSLRQALRLLARLDDATYSSAPFGSAQDRVGAHLRHIVGFYQCFLDGLDSSHIDYGSIRLDSTIEDDRDAASLAVRSVIQALEHRMAGEQERIVWVRMEDAESQPVRDCFMESSISRELQFLSSHTVHHFAHMALILRVHGIAVDPEFGMAPSTLRYVKSKTAQAA